MVRARSSWRIHRCQPAQKVGVNGRADAVTERDLQIEAIQQDLAEKSDRLAALHASRLVRLAMSTGRMLRRLGISGMDPRLGDD